MATPRGALSMMGLPDPRDKTKQDLVRMYSDYIMTGRKPGEPASAAKAVDTGEPGWGEPSEISEEEEISPDKGQLIEVDEKEEKPAAAAAEEEAAIEEDSGEEAVDAAGPLSSVSARNTYEDEILKELEAARGELLKQKRLSIADILGAGNIRKSAELIRETEKLNEQRQMKARELALDILMRKSAGEEKRQAAESLADYRRRMVEARMAAAQREPQDPSQVRADRIAAKAMFPNLSEEQAYAKYLKEVKYRPPAPPRPPADPLILRMGLIQQMRDTNKPRPPTQGELNALTLYEEQQKKDPIAQLFALALEAKAAKNE